MLYRFLKKNPAVKSDDIKADGIDCVSYFNSSVIKMTGAWENAMMALQGKKTQIFNFSNNRVIV